ncbi:LON peptidase substrate-binding domain-containing protein [Rhodoferax sp.]|uniref:LON peptidase substrate-binding domain-containing protein n=1 Tax=Rhodoferax sp. TaxID=50421 RepID=UPI0027221F2B|nr:LON peptidase substrate-binding domain-containing protein [Rhodoferax sp.]MDO9144311.1 LON peptidase substrate-binding domain-containing protein [Rhodoferax sp.]MDP3190329.1 LON peptidase substrate-binding domain-containing protein [Rhodoferax sp.]MDP3335924.1 LON peptidase substrate-binding domain-containing protein [Rhodoferax sp.]MDP3863462.1 LON peptidase substrate-binding domain-containing protein [Rhodoferax sp.]
MTDTHALDALPLFPLELVLFPGGFLPLRIFEVRYLDMVSQCEKTGAPFGVVTLTRGNEVRTAAGDLAGGAKTSQAVFHPVGTLARITQLSRPQPGLIMISCTGAQRFEVGQTELLKHGLWTGRAKLLRDDQSVPIPEDLLPVASALARVLDTLKAQGVTPEQMPIQPPYALHDCAWVANRWCDLLPMALAQKHRLMTLDNPLLRLELVSDLLERNGIAT